MHIREPQPEDADAVIALMRALAEHEGLLPYFQLTASALMTYCMETPRRFHLLVAAEGAEIIGYVTYMMQFSPWAGREYIFIDDLYVDENHRSTGAGSRLMSHVATIAVERGVEMRWHVELDNSAARRFYAKLGAELRDKTIAYWSGVAKS